LLGLFLYQDPVYCIFQWYDTARPLAAFASEVLETLGECSFLVVLLLMADGLGRGQSLATSKFYKHKLAFSALLLVLSLGMTLMAFPSVTGGSRSPLRESEAHHPTPPTNDSPPPRLHRPFPTQSASRAGRRCCK
jgi:hypothetical protein